LLFDFYTWDELPETHTSRLTREHLLVSVCLTCENSKTLCNDHGLTTSVVSWTAKALYELRDPSAANSRHSQAAILLGRRHGLRSAAQSLFFLPPLQKLCIFD